MQSNPQSTTANYISIFILTMVAFSGTVYLVYYAINKPPFDLELSMEFTTKNAIQCTSQELVNKNIPYKIVKYRESDWIVLQVIEDRDELQSIQTNECSAFNEQPTNHLPPA